MPGLRENIRNRLIREPEREPEIDAEFSTLIPPLTADEYSRLEQSIIAEGCRDALILWNNIIIDGHNRYKICKTHNIQYRTETKEFATRNDVIIWMLQNQLARRNLNDFQRIEIARKCEGAVKAQAEKRMLAGKSDPAAKLLQSTKSRDTLGKMAGVSGKTYEHATAILDKAPEPVIQAVRHNELSIHAGYTVTKLTPKEQSEIAERIENGEKPANVISQIKKRISVDKKKSHNEIILRLPPEDTAQIETLARNSNMDIPTLCAMLIHNALQNQ